MSYSAITDPCLSEEVLQQIDKTTAFYRGKPHAVPFLEKYGGDGLLLVDKLGKSLVSKFPQDQDDELWKYIRDDGQEIIFALRYIYFRIVANFSCSDLVYRWSLLVWAQGLPLAIWTSHTALQPV
jgi:hypothetical protein